MQHCPNCGAGELKMVAAILERAVIETVLAHLGLDPQSRDRSKTCQLASPEPPDARIAR